MKLIDQEDVKRLCFVCAFIGTLEETTELQLPISEVTYSERHLRFKAGPYAFTIAEGDRSCTITISGTKTPIIMTFNQKIHGPMDEQQASKIAKDLASTLAHYFRN